MKPETRRLINKYGLSRNGHAIFSPSGSAGWLNCDAYALVNAVLPDSGGVDAAYGTVAHSVAAAWLTAIRDEGAEKAEHVPQRFLGFKTVENGFEITCDKSMLHHIRRYIDWCAEVEHLGNVMIEERADYSRYSIIPQQGGTADHFVMVLPPRSGEGGMLVITDLKMGVGVPVKADGNTQALCYALGVFLEWDWLYHFRTIRLRICQPRLDYFGEWECSREELLAFGERVSAAIKRGWKENAPRTPGAKQCQWCSDKLCPAKSALLSDIVGDAFDDDEEIETPAYTQKKLREHTQLAPLFNLHVAARPAELSTAALAWRKSQRKVVDGLFAAIDEELLKREAAGEKIPGFKRVLGRRSFQWVDPETAAVVLRRAGLALDQIIKSEIISVKQARDLLRAETNMTAAEIEKFFEGGKTPLVSVGRGKPTLAPDSDDRVDFSDDVGEAFDDDGDL